MKINITDPKSLEEAYPHLFIVVKKPDMTAIRHAMKAGFSLPGVTIEDEKTEGETPAFLRKRTV